MESFRKKDASKPKQSLTAMALDQISRRTYRCIEVIANAHDFYTVPFWWRAKVVEYTTLLIISPRSLNDFRNFP